MSEKNVLLGVTASIAAYKSCDIIRSLKRNGCDVKVVMSPDAGHFITPLTLKTLSGNEVATDMFWPVLQRSTLHISLSSWAKLFLIAPATADIISKLATGSADFLLTAAALSTEAQIIIAPAMHERMFRHKAVQANIQSLKALGYKFIEPIEGALACGDSGVGHIAKTDDIVRIVLPYLS